MSKAGRKVIGFETVLLALIVMFSFVIRLYYLLTVKPPELTGDAYNYDVMVKQFLDNGFLGYDYFHNKSGEPNALITPGYPLFLSSIYIIFGYKSHSPLFEVRLIQIVLASLTSGLLYLVSKKLFKSMAIAALSSVLYSIYLVAIWVPTLLLTETLYTFLFILYFIVQIYAVESESVIINSLAGILFALSVLVRPAMAPLIVLPYLFYYMETKNIKLLKAFIYNVSGFILVMSFWWIRNLIVLKRLVLFATQEDPLLRGTYPYYEGVDNMPVRNQKQVAVKRIIEGFSNQPLLYLKWYTVGKFTYLYLNEVFYYVDSKIKTLRSLIGLHYLYVQLGWIGVILSGIKKEIRLISLYIIMMTVIHLGFVATSRYSYPVMPLLIVLCSYITVKLARRLFRTLLKKETLF
ncbi:MAG: glycosyltransferase family 39 protein [Clostridiaceae bacterium]|nr:glycosyltransferase family 39 protein [Clostridiaceae bacterium]